MIRRLILDLTLILILENLENKFYVKLAQVYITESRIIELSNHPTIE